MHYNETYATLTGDNMELRLIKFHPGDEVEIPYYWYNIISKELNKPVHRIYGLKLG